uniref:Ig-like domain-containing protein n=2 Tax=Iconisemion striatum TaxID=60296 RepID=A0A1A7WP22_9TELE
MAAAVPNSACAQRFFSQTTCFPGRQQQKMFFCFSLFIIFSMSSLHGLPVSSSDSNCSVKAVLTPSTLVVRYGGSANVTCEVCGLHGTPRFERPSLGKVTKNNTRAVWMVDKMTEWDISPLCFYEDSKGDQQTTNLPVVVYQPPEHVSISFVDHNKTLKSGMHTLLCSVSNAAPVAGLVVTFYRGTTALGDQRSTRTIKEPESHNFTLSYNVTKEDSRAEFWCETKLELGPEGPQPPPVVESAKFNPIVHYKPELLVPANPDPIIVTEGKTLQLNCSAEGNPSPFYTWEKPIDGSNTSSSVLTVGSVSFEHEGQYVCTVSNYVGSVEVRFHVDVQVDPTPYIIAAAVFFVVLMIVGGLMLYHFCYKPNRMGKYNLWNVLNMHRQHTAVPVKE